MVEDTTHCLSLQGDTEFCDAEWRPVQTGLGATERAGSRLEDGALAASLADREQQMREKEADWTRFKQKHLGDTAGLSE